MMNYHIYGLGRLLANFISLETSLRLFLDKCSHQSNSNTTHFRIENIKVDMCIEANAFTDYRQLSKLIEDYNQMVNLDCKIAKDEVVPIRNAIAHGRAFSRDSNFPLTIYKFSKVRNGFVNVEVCQILSEEWFNQSVEIVSKAIEQVVKAYENLNKSY